MEELFEYYIGDDNIHLKYAKGEPMRKDREFHDYNEFVFFTEGQSFLISKNIQQQLIEGSIVLIPKEHFHQFCISQPEKYVRLIIGFRETPELSNLVCESMNMIKVISAPDEKVVGVFKNLIAIVKSNLSDDEKILFLKSSLSQLLIYLKLNTSRLISKSVTLSPVVISTLNMIDEKYAQNLTVENIAKQLYISPSTLAHKFSKELNISVYRYIIKKRLSVARELIKQGEPVTSAASKSGFSDYSCFYRLYKKYY